MTIYAFRHTEHGTTLTEFVSRKAMNAEQDRLDEHGAANVHLRPCNAATAREYVKRGGHHETALYTNIDGHVRRAGDGY